MKSYGLNNKISNTELWALMFVFMVATSMSLPIGYTSKHDSWISAVIGTLAGLCIAWIYATLCSKFPQKSVIQIAQTLFGTWIGAVIGLMYAGYAFQLGAYCLRNFEDLTVIALLPRTPSVVIGSIMILISAWAAYQGIEVICRCALILVLFLFLQIVTFTLLLIPEMNPSLLLPVFETDWGSVLDGAAQISTSPLGETVLFIMFIPFLNRPEKLKKTVITVIGAAGAILIVTHFFNIMVMGELSSTQIFPSYTTAMYISVGDFLERIEPIVFTVWVFGEFSNVTVCLYAAALALAQAVKCPDYRIFIIPLGLALLELSLFLHPNQMDVIEFQKHIWPLVSLPFQFVIPMVLLIFSLIKRKSTLLRGAGERG